VSKNIRFFRYSGAKLKYTEKINKFINLFDNEIYAEPFIGSGAILFNLDKEFDKYIINDIDRNIIQMYKVFKDIDYKDYIDSIKFIFDKFGDIKTSKESYYNFRNWFNENYYLTETLEEGVYLHFLTNSCINSFLRFGPNGMNQSYGNRFYQISESSFNKIQGILKKSEIYCSPYTEIISKFPKALYFFDPPYFSQASSYAKFSENDLETFLVNIKSLDYIYTDILNDFNKYLDNKELIREMVSTAPLSNKSKNGNLEYIFSSKKMISSIDEW